jgi:coenzyme F420-dependent glucose-6-phosphate dehydrogenase
VAKLGYTLSSEEFDAPALVAQAERAERAGFAFASISDHFHPWVDEQGESPFVWGTLGAISQRTERIELITGVTCPTTRVHPATAAQLLPGRFSLGIGSGENLNEHITGARWPGVVERQNRLEEAIEVIRELWTGRLQSHRGEHFTVENARIYSLPDEPPPLLVAVAGESSVELAARAGDGLIGTAPVAESVQQFRSEGGAGKPTYGQLHVCWGEDEEEAKELALKQWPNGAISGSYFLELTRWTSATSPRASSAAPTPSATGQRSRNTSTPATTTSTSIRSAPTRRASSTSTSARCFPDLTYKGLDFIIAFKAY